MSADGDADGDTKRAAVPAPRNEGCAAVSIEGLSVDLGGRRVVRDLTLEVAAGEVVGLLGPSGAGKSTVFRALAGEIAADSGRIVLGAHDVTRLPLWRRARLGLGYMPQEPSVLWDFTVAENLAEFHRVAGRSRGSLDPQRLAEAVQLASRRDVRARQLSAGERRRLELARVLTVAPSLIVCDEPFAGVDPAGAATLGALLVERAEQGAAVLFADHHVAEALRICTRAVLLLDGVAHPSASPAAFLRDPLVRERYLNVWRDPPSEPPAPLRHDGLER